MELNIKFDPTISREITSVIKLIKPLDPAAFETKSNTVGGQSDRSSFNSREEMLNKISELKNKVDDLTKERAGLERQNKEYEQSIKKYSADVTKSTSALEEKDKKIAESKTIIDRLNGEIHAREGKIKEIEQTYEEMISDIENKHKVELEKKDAEIKRIQDDFNRTQRNSEDQIKTLKEKLAKYIPEDVEEGEQLLFNIDSETLLLQTGAHLAPYIANVVSDGTVLYQFNVEKGPAIKACQEKERMLLPFCDIVSDDGEGASVIRIEQWGKAKLSGVSLKSIKSEDIIEKAKIRITRN